MKFALEKQKNDSLMMQIEVTKELVSSPNAKIIITDGKTMMVNNVGDK